MAGSVNKVIIIGNLGRDPEVRSFPNGGKVCNLRIATSENWRDRNTGERKERTEFIFQKYCTFYAYSDESRKYRRGLQDILTEEQTFLYLHPMEKDRASARREKIRQMAQEIDAGQYRGYDITRFYRQRQGQEL